jgi:hypothetical protein
VSIKIYKNILKESDRKKLLKFCKTKIEDLGSDWPGLQSKNNLHINPEVNLFNEILINKYIKGYSIQHQWVNYTEGDIINWHNHPISKLSAVYFLKNPDNLGTLFRDDKYSYDKITFTKCPENSLLVFDSKKTHSQPCSPKKIKRYTIAVDLI